MRRCPSPPEAKYSDMVGELEIRPIFEADDLGENFTPELREQEERLRAEIEKKKSS